MLTECNGTPIVFQAHGRREVTASFDGGRLSSDGGALLLREADKVFGVTSLGGAVPETLADGRPPADDSVLFSRLAVRGSPKCCRRGTDPRNPRQKPKNAARFNARRCNLGLGEICGLVLLHCDPHLR